MESDYDKPINIGSDRLVTITGLADMIIRISGKRITKNYNLTAAQGVRGGNADLTLVKKMLNWQPQVTLEQGIAKTYEWIENQVNGDTKKPSKRLGALGFKNQRPVLAKFLLDRTNTMEIFG